MDKILRPTAAVIDLENLKHNINYVRSLLNPKTKMLFVLKANAYGHGAVKLAKYAQENNLCDMLGTASVEEGVELRENGIKLPVLVLGSVYPFEAFETAAAYDLAITIASLSAAKAVCEIASKINKTVYCHVKQDTGMGRIGTRRTGVAKILQELKQNKNIIIEGLYTHLSSTDSDEVFTSCQLGYFEEAALAAKADNIDVEIFHACATMGTLFAPRGRFDMVRLGLGAYGMVKEDKNFKPVLSLKSKIVFVKDVKKDFAISYNQSFIAPKQMHIATVPVGYGDGYMRAMSGKAEVLIAGKRCKVIGNITMDMIMVDVTDVQEATVGDEVVLIGKQGDEEITAWELASWANTIAYEITTLITARVPRFYK
ncbi:Alanine racemase [Elusimicrobium minutum Pei191]|uniref:Alanine racemase n=1 Tax=Elusimicrobium minutum (strain Pei191) TaxID=445932 RepID=B2KBY1_ELUMP|nr:alanine racemase [Elusimicrobium minutum]ACC97885.1 Alanine racemase [Elusimicrobium minutum Pei191]